MLLVCALPLVSILHIFTYPYEKLWSDNFPVITTFALLSSAVLLACAFLASVLQATVLLLALLWYTLLLCWLLHLCWHLLYYWLLLHCLHQLWHALLCYHLPCCCGHVAFSFSHSCLCKARSLVLLITSEWLTCGPFAATMLLACDMPLVSALHVFFSAMTNSALHIFFPDMTTSALLSSALLLIVLIWCLL